MERLFREIDRCGVRGLYFLREFLERMIIFEFFCMSSCLYVSQFQAAFEAQRLLRISDLRLESCWASYCDFRKSEAQGVKSGVAYKKSVLQLFMRTSKLLPRLDVRILNKNKK